jgi:hypothetical protein
MAGKETMSIKEQVLQRLDTLDIIGNKKHHER